MQFLPYASGPLFASYVYKVAASQIFRLSLPVLNIHAVSLPGQSLSQLYVHQTLFTKTNAIFWDRKLKLHQTPVAEQDIRHPDKLLKEAIAVKMHLQKSGK